jgi:AcrR family transcriptional regulator
MADELVDPSAPGGRIPTEPDLHALPRRERVRAVMRGEILDAARQLVQQEGIKGLTMRALGRAVGVTAPTLYDYFPSKEAVIDALFVQGTQLLTAAFERVHATTPSGRPRLLALADAYRRFALDHPDLYFLIFGRADAAYRPGPYEIECAQNIGAKADLMVQEAMAAGELAPGDPDLVANAIWAMCHGHITLELSGFCEQYGKDAGASLYQSNLELLFAGLAPR